MPTTSTPIMPEKLPYDDISNMLNIIEAAFANTTTSTISYAKANGSGGGSSTGEDMLIGFSHITFIIKNMNYVINFFLYSALSNSFRQEFLALLAQNKFLLINRCIKCLFINNKSLNQQEEGKSAISNINVNHIINKKKIKSTGKKSSSSLAELSFTMNNPLHKSSSKGHKYFEIHFEPSNFIEYIKQTNSRKKGQNKNFNNKTFLDNGNISSNVECGDKESTRKFSSTNSISSARKAIDGNEIIKEISNINNRGHSDVEREREDIIQESIPLTLVDNEKTICTTVKKYKEKHSSANLA
jgi:hypothetical protein